MLNEKIVTAYTFDDVSLVPGRAEVHPNEVDLRTQLTKQIALNIPLMSAAMDTVTESRLAIAIAQQGGIGVIHRNLSLERQAEEVDKVKRSEAGMIVDPITLRPEASISDAREMMAKFKISGVPVTDANGVLKGILTNRDLRFENNFNQPVSAVMTHEKLITVPVGISLEEAKRVLHKHRIEKLLVVDEHYNLRGLITVKDIQKQIKYPSACKDSLGRLRVAAAIGAGADLLDRVAALVDAKVDALVLDSSHGHSIGVMEAAAKVKQKYPDIALVVGNVATYEGAKELISRGADAIKVGIGPGSICTTRVVTGAGVPQVTAIAEAARAAAEAGVTVIADGGIRYSGDIAKALAAGAHCVMIGSLFAGVEESPGETILYSGRTYKSYRGMGSLGAMKDGQASRERYFQESSENTKLVPEGIEGMVPYKGTLESMVYQLIGGVRAGMGLCGCQSVDAMHKNARFVQVTAAGVNESHAHDVVITKESPNYWVEKR